MNRNKKKANDLLIKQAKCELCGSSVGLEVHHVIPLAAQLPNMDLDTEENMIVVCKKCHSILTNRKMLCKYGKKREVFKSEHDNNIIEHVNYLYQK